MFQLLFQSMLLKYNEIFENETKNYVQVIYTEKSIW